MLFQKLMQVWIRCDLSLTHSLISHKKSSYLGGNRDESEVEQRKRECVSENMKLNRTTHYLVLISLCLISNSNIAADKTPGNT